MEEIKSELALPETFQIGTIQATQIIEAIVAEFKEGVDFGVIVAGQKPVLYIPGADKCSFKFNLMATFRKDVETLEMVNRKDAIAFICELVNRNTKEKVGEGRGAAIIGEGQNCKTLNGAIKMAEIRAERDAVLRTFALRGRFTQDLEDMEKPKEETKLVVDNAGNISI